MIMVFLFQKRMNKFFIAIMKNYVLYNKIRKDFNICKFRLDKNLNSFINLKYIRNFLFHIGFRYYISIE